MKYIDIYFNDRMEVQENFSSLLQIKSISLNQFSYHLFFLGELFLVAPLSIENILNNFVESKERTSTKKSTSVTLTPKYWLIVEWAFYGFTLKTRYTNVN